MANTNATGNGTESQARRVLVVARNEDARSMLVFLLRAEGFNVFSLTEASRARTLLRLCRGPVTVILDDSVPDAELVPWLQMLQPVAQVAGVVMRQRRGALPAQAAPWLARLPHALVGQPLRIAVLVDALAAVGVAATSGATQVAARMGTTATRPDTPSAPVVRPLPS